MSENSTVTTFAGEWNALERSERLRLRRLVRMGRGIEDPTLARLAPEYARHQLARPWMRLFWLWFVPGVVLVLGIAVNIHPIAVGATIALSAQAVWGYVSLRKVARR